MKTILITTNEESTIVEECISAYIQTTGYAPFVRNKDVRFGEVVSPEIRYEIVVDDQHHSSFMFMFCDIFNACANGAGNWSIVKAEMSSTGGSIILDWSENTPRAEEASEPRGIMNADVVRAIERFNRSNIGTYNRDILLRGTGAIGDEPQRQADVFALARSLQNSLTQNAPLLQEMPSSEELARCGIIGAASIDNLPAGTRIFDATRSGPTVPTTPAWVIPQDAGAPQVAEVAQVAQAPTNPWVVNVSPVDGDTGTMVTNEQLTREPTCDECGRHVDNCQCDDDEENDDDDVVVRQVEEGSVETAATVIHPLWRDIQKMNREDFCISLFVDERDKARAKTIAEKSRKLNLKMSSLLQDNNDLTRLVYGDKYVENVTHEILKNLSDFKIETMKEFGFGGIDADRYLYMVTEPLTCAIGDLNKDLGRMVFLFNMDFLTDKGKAPISVINLDYQPNGYHAPHCYGTEPCLGDYLLPITESAMKSDFVTVFQLLVQFVTNPNINDAYGKKVKDFPDVLVRPLAEENNHEPIIAEAR